MLAREVHPLNIQWNTYITSLISRPAAKAEPQKEDKKTPDLNSIDNLQGILNLLEE